MKVLHYLIDATVTEETKCEKKGFSAVLQFGTLLLSSGISIESISKMMGHSNISSTQVYAKVTDDKISEDMDKLMAKRSGNGTCSQ